MDAQRELTLREFVSTLPKHHLAFRQLNDLLYAAGMALEYLEADGYDKDTTGCKLLREAVNEVNRQP